MGFQQNNKRKYEQEQAYRTWFETNTFLIQQSHLPPSVMQSRDDWAYFVFYGYHDLGNWTTPPFTHIDFTWEELDEPQRSAVDQLKNSWEIACDAVPVLRKRLPCGKRLRG